MFSVVLAVERQIPHNYRLVDRHASQLGVIHSLATYHASVVVKKRGCVERRLQIGEAVNMKHTGWPSLPLSVP